MIVDVFWTLSSVFRSLSRPVHHLAVALQEELGTILVGWGEVFNLSLVKDPCIRFSTWDLGLSASDGGEITNGSCPVRNTALCDDQLWQRQQPRWYWICAGIYWQGPCWSTHRISSEGFNPRPICWRFRRLIVEGWDWGARGSLIPHACQCWAKTLIDWC